MKTTPSKSLLCDQNPFKLAKLKFTPVLNFTSDRGSLTGVPADIDDVITGRGKWGGRASESLFLCRSQTSRQVGGGRASKYKTMSPFFLQSSAPPPRLPERRQRDSGRKKDAFFKYWDAPKEVVEERRMHFFEYWDTIRKKKCILFSFNHLLPPYFQKGDKVVVEERRMHVLDIGTHPGTEAPA